MPAKLIFKLKDFAPGSTGAEILSELDRQERELEEIPF